MFSRFISHCARTRAGVALSRVGLSPASAAAMVRGEKGFCYLGLAWAIQAVGQQHLAALRVGDGLSGLVLTR